MAAKNEASEYLHNVGNIVARNMGWPNDECLQATEWFLSHPGLYEQQRQVQPSPFREDQDDVSRFEGEYEDFVITLEELANTGGFKPAPAHFEDVDWEVVADYLLAISEHG